MSRKSVPRLICFPQSSHVFITDVNTTGCIRHAFEEALHPPRHHSLLPSSWLDLTSLQPTQLPPRGTGQDCEMRGQPSTWGAAAAAGRLKTR